MTADARRRAKEALAAWKTCVNRHEDACFCSAWALQDALIALLASEPAPPDGAEVAHLTALLRECNAVCLCGCPESEHESYGEDGESCGHDDHECIRVAPAVLEIVQRYRVALSDALAQKPAGAEVREAAEARFATRPDRGDNKVPYCSEQCPQHDGKRCRILGGRPWGICEPEVLNILSDLAALRATASPAPGSEGVREAEAVLAEAREALDEIRRRSTDKLAGGIAASFLGAHPRAALRGGQKGGE